MKQAFLVIFLIGLMMPLISSAQSEQEIPVNLEQPKKAVATENSFLRFGVAFGIIGVLGCGSYLLLRRYRFSNSQTEKMQVKVLTQHYLGPKKSLAIIRVAGESMLIGVTDHNINLIKSLALLDEELPDETQLPLNKNFASVLTGNKPTSSEKTQELPDDFAFSGIKDLVSTKLKNMRNL
jgi:flagellar protein FliO/FliZ